MIHRILPWIALVLAVALFVALVRIAKADRGPADRGPADVPQAVARWLPAVERHAVIVWGHDRHVARTGAQIAQESAGRPDVYSHAGACGLMQFMPATWREQSGISGRAGDCRDPELSIGHGIAYMQRLHRMQSRTASGCELWRQALAAYNWGIGSVRRAIRRYGTAWLSRAPRETQGYMRILRREHDYIRAGWPGVPVCAI